MTNRPKTPAKTAWVANPRRPEPIRGEGDAASSLPAFADARTPTVLRLAARRALRRSAMTVVEPTTRSQVRRSSQLIHVVVHLFSLRSHRGARGCADAR